MNGHEGVVEMLLGRGDTNPDKQDIYSQTSLLYPPWNGPEKVVEIVSRYDVNPNKPDNGHHTPPS